MSVSPSKLAVLAALQQAQQPLAVSTIVQMIEGTTERSVRRWLAEWIDKGKVSKIGQKKSTRYMAIAHLLKNGEFSTSKEPSADRKAVTDKTPLLAQSLANQNSIFSVASQQLLQPIQQPLFKRAPIGYQRDWLLKYQPNQTFYLSGQQREMLHAQGERTQADAPAGTYARQIFNRLLIDLSYNSSRLEGNTYSKLETERLLLQGEATLDKLNEETIMILNHKEAIRYLVDSAHRLQVDAVTIATLHYLLADGLVPANLAGQVRDHGVRIGQSTYIPLEVSAQLQKTLEQICLLANSIKDPFEQSFFLLIHLAYLQAFTDVNKRTSRLSANIPLIRHNLVPLSFNDVPKDDYLSAMLLVYEYQNPAPLAELYLYSYSRTCQAYQVTTDSLGIDQTRVRFRHLRRQLLGDIIRQQLKEPELSTHIKQYAAQYIPIENRDDFLRNLQEDLSLLSPARSVGLGVSQEELMRWQTKNL